MLYFSKLKSLKDGGILTPNVTYLIPLILGSSIIFFWRLGQGSLIDWDEAIYAQVAKEIVQEGHWLTLHWGYEPWFHKPPLFMWTTAVFYQLFGISEFSARIASALSGVGLVILIYAIANYLYNKKVGFIAALLLMTTPYIIDRARFGTTDVMLTLFLYVAIYAYLKVNHQKYQYWYLVGIGCALSFMVKGVAGLVAPIVIFLCLCLQKKLILALKTKEFYGALFLAAAIALPWHLYVFIQHDQTFINEYLGYHVVARSMTPLEGHQADYLYYLYTLQSHFYPAFFFVPFALAFSMTNYLRRNLELLVFIGVVFGLYTLVQTKLEWYILPIYPALAILVAAFLDAMTHHQSQRRKLFLLMGSLFTLLLLNKLYIAIALVMAFLSILIIYKMPQKIFCYGWIAILVIATIVGGLFQSKPVYQKVEQPIAQIGKLAYQDRPNPLIAANLNNEAGFDQPTLMFYSNRPVYLVSEVEQLPEILTQVPQQDLVVRPESVSQLETKYKVKKIAQTPEAIYIQIREKL